MLHADFGAATGTCEDKIEEALADIAVRSNGSRMSVFLLGRYRFSAPKDLKTIQARWSARGLDITFQTAHKSKGSEADYVVLLGLEAGNYGFPSNVADDPVVNMVLSESEDFAYGEERRLFYVAATRAKNRIYVLAPQNNPSTFVADELMTGSLTKFVEQIGEVSTRRSSVHCVWAKRSEKWKAQMGHSGLVLISRSAKASWEPAQIARPES